MLSGEGNDNRSRVRFFGRIQKRICDLRTCGFFITKKTVDPKRIIYDNGMCSCISWGENNTLILAAKIREK